MKTTYQCRLRLTPLQVTLMSDWLELLRRQYNYRLTYDAAWGTFLQILKVKAESAGLTTIAVNPKGTTQDCSGCGQKVPKTIRDRWHSCPNCGLELDRDHNAAINIKQRAVGHPVLKAQVMSEAIAGVTEKPALYAKHESREYVTRFQRSLLVGSVRTKSLKLAAIEESWQSG